MTNCFNKFHFLLEIFTTGTYAVHEIANEDRRQKERFATVGYCFNLLVTILDSPRITSVLSPPLPPPLFPVFWNFLRICYMYVMRNWPTLAVIFDLDPESWFGVFVISISATIGESKARVSTGSNSIPPAKVVIGHHRFSGRPPARSRSLLDFQDVEPTHGIRGEMYRTFWSILVNSFASCSWRYEKYYTKYNGQYTRFIHIE